MEGTDAMAIAGKQPGLPVEQVMAEENPAEMIMQKDAGPAQEDEPVIGLEVHCQLDTATKLFCSCSTDYRSDGPNTHTCPICLGLPGSLPAINRKAIEFALRVAKALNCEVLEESVFSRKNYFYPDLDKAFQISQYDKPLAVGGYLTIDGDNAEKTIRITRVHVEEDPGRLVHKGGTDRARYSLVDYNRAGIPLIEIVTEPDMRSPKEARKFLNKLRATLEYLSVFDSEKEGSLRVDANISIQPKGWFDEHHKSYKGRNRVEVKNISSYKGVEKALTFEITRQKNMIRKSQPIEQATRHFVETQGITTSGRSKEEEQDYRYFPEPDLCPLRVRSWVHHIELPELPDARRARFIGQYGCSQNHAKTLTGDLKLAMFYEAVAGAADPALAATWIADTLLGELNYRDMTIARVDPGHMADLVTLVAGKKITDKNAIEVLRVMLDEIAGNKPVEMPHAIAARLDLGVTGGGLVTDAISSAISENPQAVNDYRAGKNGAFMFLVGQVMKKTKGRADPGELNRELKSALEKEGRPG
jgi:aspartyl-tRNA(Asn)/glutamyl-tRNA(Gln) amidotransferase subunit B